MRSSMLSPLMSAAISVGNGGALSGNGTSNGTRPAGAVKVRLAWPNMTPDGVAMSGIPSWKLTELWKNQRTVFPQLLEPSVHSFQNAGCALELHGTMFLVVRRNIDDEFGSDHTYGQGFPSYWCFTEDCTPSLTATPTLRKIIPGALDPLLASREKPAPVS
jgi:hypothetical protein